MLIRIESNNKYQIEYYGLKELSLEDIKKLGVEIDKLVHQFTDKKTQLRSQIENLQKELKDIEVKDNLDKQYTFLGQYGSTTSHIYNPYCYCITCCNSRALIKNNNVPCGTGTLTANN